MSALTTALPTRRMMLTAGCAAFAGVACGGGRAAGAPQGPLVIVGAWHVGGFEPAVGGQQYCMLQIAETLVDVDLEGRLTPLLATRWAPAPDGLAWTFTLRPGVRFHDGQPMTPSHVARVLDRARSRPGVLQSVPIDSVTAGDGTVVIRLSRPYVWLPSLLAHFSTQILAASAFDKDDRVTSIVGTGPFRLVSVTQPQQADAVRFDDWHGGTVGIEALRYLSVSRAETRALAAEGAQADLVYDLDPATVDRLLPRLGPRLLTATNLRSVVLLTNCRHRFLSDVRARQAISLAVDREGIAQGIFRSAALAGTQLCPPRARGWHVPHLTPLRHDVAAARRLLADLGWTPGADGVLRRGGDRFALTLLTYPDRAELPVLGAALQDQLREVGIALDVSVGNSGDIPLAHRDGSLELALASRNYAAAIDPTMTVRQDFGTAVSDWGPLGWREPGLDEAFGALTAELDVDVAERMKGDIATRIHTSLPVVPIAWYRQGLAVSARIRGASLDPLERSYRVSGLAWSGGGVA